ncbi:MAG: FAD-dependent oxidoreductase [Thermoanaerobacteraceae bacterium]|nr:FAD-dependent oxidoreductase [Thermoanaerobacteraceae bacterium]
MIRLNIDGKEVSGYKGQTILEIARQNGIDIPTLCFDERLEPYGSCGMCVVEVEGNKKLLRSCATEAADGMIVSTNSQRVVEARRFTLELLLSEHRGDCRPPCVMACPTHCDAQGYAALINNGQYEEALKLIKETVPLPASVGRICPHPCEEACRRGLVDEPVSICNLKRFVGDYDLASGSPYMPEIKPSNGMKAAVIGAGPAGLSAAYFLKKDGYDVTIFEKMPEAGGMLRYGIPEYRLPKSVLEREISLIEGMGVDIKTNTALGKDFNIDSLRNQGFDAMLLAVGAQNSSALKIPGEDAEGVIGGVEFLRNVALNQPVTLGHRVIVVGGGNTAMDAARTAIRLGADEVTVVYRRTKNEMPARREEIEEAEEEGIRFVYLAGPKEVVVENGKMAGVRFQKMQLGEPDASGRRSPVPIPGEELYIEADSCIAAIGQQIDLTGLDGIAVNRNRIVIEEGTYRTNIPYVFAAGDAVTGPDIAVRAIATGKEAAFAIETYLNGELKPVKLPYLVKQEDITPEDLAGREKISRNQPKLLSAEVRRDNFKEYLYTFDEESARAEGARCLECGCLDYFDCKLYQYSNMYDVKPERLPGVMAKRDKDYSSDNILRDPNKCILCGLCVRACDEIAGPATLGYVRRGFEAVTKPEFENLLINSSCIFCGECAYVCPTGAIMTVNDTLKPLPVRAEEKVTTCTGCSLTCQVIVESRGEMMLRIKPYMENGFDDGLLCSKGSFGFDWVNGKYRITEPLIRDGEKLSLTTMENALKTMAKEVMRFVSTDSGKLAVLVSSSLTSEEGRAVKEIFKDFVSDEMFYTIGSGMEYDVLPLKSIEMADAIITKGIEMEEYPQVFYWIRKALKRGAKHLAGDVDIDAIKEAKKPYLVYREGEDVEKILSILPSIKKIPLRQAVNTNGLKKTGYNMSTMESLNKKISNREILGLIIVGNVDGLNPLVLSGLKLLVDITPVEKDLRPIADIVIPYPSPLEKEGTIAGDFGERRLNKALDGMDAMEVLREIAQALNRSIKPERSINKETIYLR